MANEQARAIVDYAYDDQGKEVRDALYSAIQDKVMAHIEAHKESIAKNLIAQPQELEVEASTVENA